MTEQEQAVLVAGGAALAVLALLALVLAALAHRRAAQLRGRVLELESQLLATSAAPVHAAIPVVPAAPGGSAPAASAQLLITGLGAADPAGAPLGAGPAGDVDPVRVEGRLFADLVLRESLVKAAALAHGVRRGLAPESRNRIRFEVRREVRRSRRERRADVRRARREHDARQRAAADLGVGP